MDSNVDFGKIAFNSVKQFIVQGHAPDMVDLIMDDFVSGDGFSNSFSEIANQAGLYIAEEIFNLFLTDEAVEEYSKAWEDAS